VRCWYGRGAADNTSLAGAPRRLAVAGISNAFMLGTVAVAAIHAVPHRLAGTAAAADTALRQYGATLGPAVLGVILANRIVGGASMPSALHTALTVNAATTVRGHRLRADGTRITSQRRLTGEEPA
jgi:hypothetical protein